MLSKALIVLAFLVGATLKVEASPVNQLYIDYESSICLRGLRTADVSQTEILIFYTACGEFIKNFDSSNEQHQKLLKLYAYEMGMVVEKQEQWRLLEKDHE